MKSIPPKKELLRLQSQFRTDKKIGEALGGVPARLVAYWRKKKKVSEVSLPKFSQRQIRNLWEEWGSDKLAAAQLGTTPAAFYKWRRRYGLSERPRVLKSSQLSLALFDESRPAHLPAQLTLAEKIVSSKLREKAFLPGHSYQLEPDLIVLSSDWEKLLAECGQANMSRIRKTDRVWAVVPAVWPDPELGKETLAFLKANKVKNILCREQGGVLQVLWEKNLISPLTLVIGTERGILGTGFLGAWGRQVDCAGLAQLFETGKLTLSIPPTLQIVLEGELSEYLFASDIYYFLRKRIRAEQVRDKILQISGPVLSRLSLPQRQALSLLWTQAPVAGLLLSLDQTVRKHSLARHKKSVPLTEGDSHAYYTERLEFDLSHLEPLLSCSAPVDRISPVSENKRRPVRQIVLGAASAGRLEEFQIAARILNRKKIHPEVQLLLVPSSRKMFLSALKKGYIKTLLEAGGIICDPGLEGLGQKLSLTDPVLTTCGLNSNHNTFFNQQEIMVGNAATAAASALKGKIADPRDYL